MFIDYWFKKYYCKNTIIPNCPSFPTRRNLHHLNFV